MSRYRGPRFKKIRRRGALPGLTNKRPKVVGGEISISYSPRRKTKLLFHYGLTGRQLLKYVRIARKSKGSTGQVLL